MFIVFKHVKRINPLMVRFLILLLVAGFLPFPPTPALAADTQAPTAPTQLSSTWRTTSSAHLSWLVPSDDTGVTGYDVYKDGLLLASITGAPIYLATGLTAGVNYSFTVRAKDLAGNISSASSALTVNLDEMDRFPWSLSSSHNNSGTALALAVDNAASTRWASGAAQAIGMWLQIDTGPGAKTYNRLVIDSTNSAGDYARGYEIKVSEDGQTWSTAIAQGNGSVVTDAQFPAQMARYIRVILTKSNGSWWSVHNLKLYGSVETDQTAPAAPEGETASQVTESDVTLQWNESADNVKVLGYEIYNGNSFAAFSRNTNFKITGLLPKTAYTYKIRAIDLAGNVSSWSDSVPVQTTDQIDRTLWSASSSANNGGAGAAIDGNASSRWSSGAAQAAGTWFQIDMGPGDKTYNKLVLNATGSGSDYAREFDITVSPDGVNWSAPLLRVTGTSAIVTAVFPEQTARYFRLTLSKSAGSYWSIHELHAYGTIAPDMNPPSAPGNLSVNGVLDTQLDVSWDASTDDVAVVGYNLYVNGQHAGYTNQRNYRITGLSPSTAYDVVVKAKDLYGNESLASTAVPFTTMAVIEAPLIAKYDMEPNPENASAIIDTSGFNQNGSFSSPAALIDGRPGGGKALQLSGADQARVSTLNQLNKISSSFTITAWIKPDDLNGYQPIVTKRDANWKGTTFYLGLQDKMLYYGADYGEKWFNWKFPSSELAAGQWAHVAVTFKKYVGASFYVNGKLIGTIDGSAVFTDLLPNDVTMLLGTEWHYNSATRAMVKYGFRGAIDSLHMYASPLTLDQVKADMNGSIATRMSESSDFTAPTKYATFRLVRFDAPTGLFTKGSAKIHQSAVRVDGPNAVDWPDIKLHIPQANQNVWTVQPFAGSSEFKSEILLQQAPQNMSMIEQSFDNVFHPGNHWVRGVAWRWGQTNMYTADRTARSWTWDYELWTFPVRIQASTPGAVQNVVLKNDGVEIYNSGTRSFDSLTLLLPQNETGKPYELWVDGRGPVSFNAGLQPIVAGNPKDIPYEVNMTLPGTGPAITVQSQDQPEAFPNQAAWDADVQALSGAKPVTPNYASSTNSIKKHLGVDVPRSAETINFVYLPHGMSSGGFYHAEHPETAAQYANIGTVEEYADYVADTGYDRVYEFSSFEEPTDVKSQANMAQELSERGVQLGLIPRTDWDTISTSSQNLPFYSSYIADYHAPLYRDIQLSLQRLQAYPNLAGVSLGADNAGYASYWDWAPPHPNRPWGRAFTAFQTAAGLPLTTPLAPSLQGGYTPKTHEYFAATTKPFLDYIARYNETFKNFGYFSKAVSEVNSSYTTTTGSFGSSPGVGGRGGWVWATIPGKEMHEQLPVQSIYDWNEKSSSKPLHVVSLIDRLKSYYPNKTTWAVQDDFSLFFGKTDREKAYALALTRGIQAIGTNVLPNNKGGLAKPQIIADQKSLYDWIHRYGGPYAMTETTPSIGIMYVNEQALLRNIVGGENPSDAQLLAGSHEGKVTEALFLTHAAGWPSKIITPEELKRGLPSSIKAILLVGLNEYDDSWSWSDGITSELQGFVSGGGVILRDDESVSPVDSIDTNMQIRSYVIQSDTDQTNILLSRNADNMSKLQAAMDGISRPIAVSGLNDVWAIPTRSGDTKYVTVLNQKHDTAANNSQHLIGQTAQLEWNTNLPIYDVRLGRKITQAEAEQVDLQAHGFQWYALPPAEVTVPELAVHLTDSGFYEAYTTVRNPNPMSGIPVEITVSHAASGDTAAVYSATGLSAKLPLKNNDAPGSYTVTVKELLSGLEASTSVVVQSEQVALQQQVKIDREEAVRKFSERGDVPLTVALTAAQHADTAIVAQANRLVQHYNQQGREAQLGLAEPGGVVKSLQEYQALLKFPKWKTVDSDLVLFGSTSSNVLLLDQARAYLLPEQGDHLTAGEASVSLVNSAFLGEYHALNILTNDTAGITAAVDALIGLAASPPEAPRYATITRVTDNMVELAWFAGEIEADSYKIERRTNGNASWQAVATVSGGTNVFQDSGLNDNSFYSYRIKALNGVGESAAGEILYVITSGAMVPTPYDPEAPLSRTGWTASASHGAYKASNALDGLAATRWDTGIAQVNGQYFQIDMQMNRTFNKLVLDTSGSSGDYARKYEVYVSTDGTTWGTAVAAGSGSTVTTIHFPSQTARYIRIVQTGSVGVFWSIHELNLYHVDTEAPSTPTGLTVTHRTDTTVALSWNASTDLVGVTGYDVFHGSQQLNGSLVTGTSFTVTGLTQHTQYHFTVRARDAAGNLSAVSLPVTVITEGTPLSRSGWTATASHQSHKAQNALDGVATTRWDTATSQVYGQYFQVDLQSNRNFSTIVLDTSGSSSDYPRKYEVYTSTDGLTWGAAVAAGSGNSVTTIHFPTQFARYIRIVQTGSVGLYWSIHELNVFNLDSEGPTVPSNLLATSLTETSVGLSWTASSDLGGVSGYDVYSGSQKVNVARVTSTSYTVTGLTPNTPYSFSVKAVDASGNQSAASLTANITTNQAPISRVGWTATASHQSFKAQNALDGVVASRWDTATAQVYGQYIQVDMLTNYTFDKIVLDASGSSGDYPRSYQVYVSADGTNWGAVVASGTGSAVSTVITFPAQTGRYMRIVQTGSVGVYWSIHELYVYE
jgi:chitodextrinase